MVLEGEESLEVLFFEAKPGILVCLPHHICRVNLVDSLQEKRCLVFFELNPSALRVQEVGVEVSEDRLLVDTVHHS